MHADEVRRTFEMSHKARIEAEIGSPFNNARMNSRNGGSIANLFSGPASAFIAVLDASVRPGWAALAVVTFRLL
jgi:hypothetical protein